MNRSSFRIHYDNPFRTNVAAESSRSEYWTRVANRLEKKHLGLLLALIATCFAEVFLWLGKYAYLPIIVSVDQIAVKGKSANKINDNAALVGGKCNISLSFDQI